MVAAGLKQCQSGVAVHFEAAANLIKEKRSGLGVPAQIDMPMLPAPASGMAMRAGFIRAGDLAWRRDNSASAK